ncbi:hypothetical protein FQA39_LY02172 [Lamprigera yunnana]|nr:hypothetical protein FQA39_LY02172 [Lamprigera yunnana]
MKPFSAKICTTLGYIIQYGCVAHCLFNYIGDVVVCAGTSMEPAVYSDDVVFIEHITPRLKSINKGDVIIAKCPTNPKQYICKRIVGLPGEKMKVGFAKYEIVPRGHVWLEGDNKDNSSDSRMYGPVPLGLIRSRALFIIWPFSHISRFSKEY